MEWRYVYSERLAELEKLNVPYVAVSCFDPAGLAEGRVGFETTEYSLAIRNALLQRSWTFDGDINVYVGDALASSGVPFFHTSDWPQRARVVTRKLGSLVQREDSQNISEDVLNKIAKIQNNSGDLRTDIESMKKLFELHVSNELEMQVWPYNTKYESYFIYLGAEIEVLIENIRAFFDEHGLKLEAVDARSFPRY